MNSTNSVLSLLNILTSASSEKMLQDFYWFLSSNTKKEYVILNKENEVKVTE